MLKLRVTPGEFLLIGNDIKIIFAGGDKNKIPIAIEAPKNVPIVRSSAKDMQGFEGVDKMEKPYVEKSPLSQEAKHRINAIIAEELRKQKFK